MAAGMKQKALAAALNRPLSWVRARLALVGLPTAVQDAIDAGTYEPSDALTFAKYADRPDVIDTVLADNYRSGADLDWRLQRAAEAPTPPSTAKRCSTSAPHAGWTRLRRLRPRPTPTASAKPLDALGIDHADHAGETCHLIVITGGRHQRPDMTPWCIQPRRHITKGASAVQVDRRPRRRRHRRPTTTPPPNAKPSAPPRPHAPAATTSPAKRSPPSSAAATSPTSCSPSCSTSPARPNSTTPASSSASNPHPPAYQGGGKDYATPLREWAGQSTANLTRAMLAIAYVHATATPTYAGDSWRQTSRQAVAAWLDGLGYQPEP